MKKNQKKLIVPAVICGGVVIIGAVVLFIGLATLTNNDIAYEEAKIDCDDKDYSSYVVHTQVSTPGNESINSQIKIVKDAMEQATNANDAVAFGQLWEEHNRLLTLQSQTSTTQDYYDYSKVDEAKEKCYKLALGKKESSHNTGMWMSIGGGSVLVVGLLIACMLAFAKMRRKN